MTIVEGRLVGSGRAVRIATGNRRITEIADVPSGPQCWIAPGFVDIQVNGHGGIDVNRDDLEVEQVFALVEQEWARGVTALCPTLVSASEERITTALAVIAQARREDALVRHGIPCVHVEGPYLSSEDGPRGAHALSAIRSPDIAELGRWQHAGQGLVGIVTLAPELAGALAYVREASDAGVIVALGHTAASSEQITDAVDAGAKLSTHLGNGCRLQLRRHPNHLWAQLSEDRLQASFIADGHHLPAATLTAMVRSKGVSRSILVSDSVALAGSPPGSYTDTPVGKDVTLSDDGRLSVTGSEVLAGSVRCLPDCLAWAIRYTDLQLEQATAMAATNPCRLLSLGDRGELRLGASADMTIFDLDTETGSFRLDATVVAGRIVSRAVAAASIIKE